MPWLQAGGAVFNKAEATSAALVLFLHHLLATGDGTTAPGRGRGAEPVALLSLPCGDLSFPAELGEQHLLAAVAAPGAGGTTLSGEAAAPRAR